MPSMMEPEMESEENTEVDGAEAGRAEGEEVSKDGVEVGKTGVEREVDSPRGLSVVIAGGWRPELAPSDRESSEGESSLFFSFLAFFAALFF